MALNIRCKYVLHANYSGFLKFIKIVKIPLILIESHPHFIILHLVFFNEKIFKYNLQHIFGVILLDTQLVKEIILLDLNLYNKKLYGNQIELN
ncbi:hypothetical protein HZS_5522 [Henneguya salminicola]|nr:hypothetical protein HZS_5522 [Henneguya salminicola]